MLNEQAEEAHPAQSLWKHSEFLKLWAAQTISVTGDQFTNLAIPLIATLTLGASARQMGVLAAMGTAPFLLISLFAGIWVDRLPRRPILVVSDLGRAVILLSVPLVALAHTLRMAQLYAVQFLVGVLSVFFETSYQAFLPSLVEKESLVEGNSKLAATSSIAGLVGPSLAGIVIQYVSAPFAIVLDAMSFLGSGGLIGLIQGHETQQPKSERLPMLTEIREGIGFVFGNPLIRSITGCTATFNFFYMAVSALYILFATRELGLGPSRIGLILGIGNIAGLLGAVGASWLSKRFGVGPTMIVVELMAAVGMVPLAFATPRTAFRLLLFSRLVFNFAIPVFNVNQMSLRQAITPHRLRGRMTATVRFFVWGALPLGGLAGGLLGQSLGVKRAIVIAVTGMLTAFLWILFSPVRELRTMPKALD